MQVAGRAGGNSCAADCFTFFFPVAMALGIGGDATVKAPARCGQA
jgi:hypothetical protein